VWLHGAAADLLLGAGLAYLLSIPLLLVAANVLGLSEWSLEAVLLMGLAFSTPHYGATLLRVYERAEDRRRYAYFAVHASIAIALLVVAALYSPWLGSLIVTIYMAWSPWHFAGQNYGLGLIFLRRHGVEVKPSAKRALYASFLLSFVLTFLVFQTQGSNAAFGPDFTSTARTYAVMRIGIPWQLTRVLAPLVLLSIIGSLAFAAVVLWQCGARRAALAPVGMLALSQSVWFTMPAFGAMVGRPLDGLAFAAVWSSVAHSIQYLWVTSYYARREQRESRLISYYLKALLAGCLIGVLPGLLVLWLAPGAPSWTGGLALLLFSALNIHHFVLDGAIWKLREGRVARVLLRTGAASAQSAGSQPANSAGGSAARRTLWAIGVLCLAVVLTEVWEVGAYRSRDLAQLRSAAQRLAWIGRERAALLGFLGDAYLEQDQRASAVETYRHALSLRRDPAVANNLAWMLSISAESSTEERAEAVALAREAVAYLGEDHYNALNTLAAAYASVGRYQEAGEVAERAVALASERDPERAAEIASRLVLYRAGRPYRVEGP